MSQIRLSTPSEANKLTLCTMIYLRHFVWYCADPHWNVFLTILPWDDVLPKWHQPGNRCIITLSSFIFTDYGVLFRVEELIFSRRIYFCQITVVQTEVREYIQLYRRHRVLLTYKQEINLRPHWYCSHPLRRYVHVISRFRVYCQDDFHNSWSGFISRDPGPNIYHSVRVKFTVRECYSLSVRLFTRSLTALGDLKLLGCFYEHCSINSNSFPCFV